MRSYRSAIGVFAVLALLAAAPVDAKKKKQTDESAETPAATAEQGLSVESGVDLGRYRDSLLILEPTDISANEDRPVDTESVRSMSDDLLLPRLGGIDGVAVMTLMPPQLPEGRPALRIYPVLTLQYGSRGFKRYVGAGPGQQKLQVRIDIVDPESGRLLASFKDDGGSRGLFKFGDKVEKIARETLERSYDEFSSALAASLN